MPHASSTFLREPEAAHTVTETSHTGKTWFLLALFCQSYHSINLVSQGYSSEFPVVNGMACVQAFTQFRDTSTRVPDSSLVAYFKDNRFIGGMRGRKPQRVAPQAGTIEMLISKVDEALGSKQLQVANAAQADRTYGTEMQGGGLVLT